VLICKRVAASATKKTSMVAYSRQISLENVFLVAAIIVFLQTPMVLLVASTVSQIHANSTRLAVKRFQYVIAHSKCPNASATKHLASAISIKFASKRLATVRVLLQQATHKNAYKKPCPTFLAFVQKWVPRTTFHLVVLSITIAVMALPIKRRCAILFLEVVMRQLWAINAFVCRLHEIAFVNWARKLPMMATRMLHAMFAATLTFSLPMVKLAIKALV
jgi:hypothetical protein